MPPTFLYLLFFGLWVLLAFAVWIVAAVLALFPKQRRTGLQLAAAMAGTFRRPLLPIAGDTDRAKQCWELRGSCGRPRTEFLDGHFNPMVIVASIVSVGLVFVIVVTMSLTGFWEGWRVGWAFAAGKDFRSVVRPALCFRIAAYARRRVRFARSS
jgi:hypothetical protein